MSIESLLKIVSENAPGRLEQLGLFDLLEKQRMGSSLMLYGSAFNRSSIMLHSILVPASDLENIEDDDLTSWQGNPFDLSSCGLVWGGGLPPRVEFNEADSRVGINKLRSGQRLVFGRSFDGRREFRSYFEIAPFLTHAHGLHWTPERRAWCRFDNNGDIEDVITWTEVKGREGYGNAVCISIKREVIEMQMSATGMVLIQMFDSTCVPKSFHGWNSEERRTTKDKKKSLYYRSSLEGANGSFVRGVQIIRPERTAEEYGSYLEALENQPRQYESFITVDWKNNQVILVSCSPDAIASYFDKGSPLPFHTSPVFFNAAVLDKYKADPEKYSLEHRSISCRNSWHLSTYDVNKDGQVHTYIKYLGDLPYAEQIYWKAFNEQPKRGISKRAYTTDFMGSFDQEPDSLLELQGVVLELHRSKAPWFTLREPSLAKQIHYPLTDSSKGWGDTLANLDKLVIEGLEKKFFEGKARELGAEAQPKWGSIRWAQELMLLSGVDGEVITEVIEPLHDLHNLRSKLGAHSGGAEANSIRAGLLGKYQSPRGHVEYICGQIMNSLQTLNSLYGS